MTPIIVSVVAFVGVAALVGAVATFFRGDSASKIEDRLDILAGLNNPAKGKGAVKQSLIAQLNTAPNLIDALMRRLGNFSKVFEQADTNLTPARFFAITGGLAVGGAMLAVVMQFRPWM